MQAAMEKYMAAHPMKRDNDLPPVARVDDAPERRGL